MQRPSNRWAPTALLLALCAGWPSVARTADTPPLATVARNQVVLRVVGELLPTERAGLTALLEADFQRRALALSLDADQAPLRPFIDARRAQSSTLLIAVLDVRRRNSWQLSIVDAARGRAIVRVLPGGVEANAAVVEAVASIISSAASALGDGLEVASQSIDEAMSEAEPSVSGTSKPPAAPPASPHTAPEPSFGVRSSLSIGVASFASQAKLSTGFSAALGLRLGAITPRLSGTRYLSTELATPLGSFRIARTGFGLSLGRSFAWEDLELEPELALLFELLRRNGAQSTSLAAASADSSLYRVGGLLSLRLRYRLATHVAVEWTSGGSYFPTRVRFLAANPQPSELAVLWPWGVSSQLGLEIRAP